MFAIRQMIDDPQDFIPVPAELRHRPTEVIFIALDHVPEAAKTMQAKQTPAGYEDGDGLEPSPLQSIDHPTETKNQ
ncbi:hypothetical protein [Allochromatium vinosum]|uniref:Uncharacterized protein n=1 Tax=Allochromatium vinosum (strain ATCC 17899 / DSM 180 / NBRC 103801 / NCIMB 10441 / D) TaxID=572477 RepID=D3RWE2_ALLVD|nr:hypothetical protein [Allochromatium vinosum]ADC64154.1 hypothetical protein Alvin_3263 [Allochromatium vinosum DSM 180]